MSCPHVSAILNAETTVMNLRCPSVGKTRNNIRTLQQTHIITNESSSSDYVQAWELYLACVLSDSSGGKQLFSLPSPATDFTYGRPFGDSAAVYFPATALIHPKSLSQTGVSQSFKNPAMIYWDCTHLEDRKTKRWRSFSHIWPVWREAGFLCFDHLRKLRFCPWQIVCMCDIFLKRCKRLPLVQLAFRFSLSGQMWEPSITLSVLTKDAPLKAACSPICTVENKTDQPNVIWALIQYISLYCILNVTDWS